MKKNFAKIFGLGGRNDQLAQCAPLPPSQNRLWNNLVIKGLKNNQFNNISKLSSQAQFSTNKLNSFFCLFL